MKRLAIFLAVLFLASPAAAQTAWQKANAKLPIPLPTAKPAAAAAPAAGQLDPLTWLRQFSYNDVNNAYNDAVANNNLTSAPCWKFVLTLIPAPATAANPTPTNSATSILPTTPGIASAVQKALDDQQLLLNWFQPNGTLDQLNLACAPLLTKVNAQLIGGGTAIAAAIAAGPAGTAALATGLSTLLGGAVALPKL